MKRTIFCFLIVTLNLFAQQVGDWKNYTSMKTINAVSSYNNIIWAATNGGIFGFNTIDSSYITLTKSEGLSSQTITSIAIDIDGNVWAGSDDGIINVYLPASGTVKKLLDIYNSDKTKKQINDIVIQGDTVFVATDFGLSLVNAKTFTFIETVLKFGNFTTETKVFRIAASNNILAAHQQGIAISKNGTTNFSSPDSWDTYSLPASININSLNKILYFNNQIILATNKGLFTISGSSIVTYDFLGTNITDMLVKNDSLFVSAGNSVFVFNNGISSRYLTPSNLTLNDITILKNGVFAFGTNSGLLFKKSSNYETIFPHGPANNSFLCLAVNKNGNIWVGTGKDLNGIGLMFYNGTEWKNFNTQNSPLPLDDYYKVSVDNFDNAYGFNWGRGYATLTETQIDTFTTFNTSLVGIPKDHSFLVISGAEKDEFGNLWILNYWSGEKKPLSVLTPDNTWHHFGVPILSLSSDALFEDFLIDQYNTKWFTITDKHNGLYYFNDNNTVTNTNDDKWGVVSTSDGLNDLGISCIALDNKGAIWVGSQIGVNIIPNPNSPKAGITSVFPVRQQAINCIAVDALNQKWIGTNQGLFLLTTDGSSLIYQYTKSNSPIPTNEIKSLAVDKERGIIYIGTDYGLSSLYTSAIEPVSSFSDIFVYPNPFYINDGNNSQLRIRGLVKESSIKILSLTGKLIAEFDSPGGDIAFWNGKDNDGQFVSSGIYLLTAYDAEGDNVAVQKVAVFKK